MLEAKNITKSFAGMPDPVLNGVSCTLQKRQITCLIGPSGGGKTTLLRALALLEAPESGSIRFNDKMITFPHAGEMPAVYPDLTVVFQSHFLWPHLSLYENIALPARNKIADNKALHAKIAELSALFDLSVDGHLSRFPNEASLGQRQRVALIRALILEPRYLLLDEVTSALDVTQVEKVLAYLIQLKEQDVSIFLITHLLGFAKRAADQVLYLENGLLVETGSAAILTNPQSPQLKRFLNAVG